MSHSAVLDPLLLGAVTLFDAKRQAVGTRLTLHPLTAAAPSAAELQALLSLWTADDGPAWLNPTSETWLDALAAQPLPEHLMLEVPAFLAADPRRGETWLAQSEPRARWVLAGTPSAPLAPGLAPAWAWQCQDAGSPAALAGVPQAQRGHADAAAAGAALKSGAGAVVGWPLGDSPDPNTRRRDVPPGVGVVMELIQLVDQEAPAPKLEAVLRRDPSLAYRLMRFLNSPGFGLSVEINSFQHALMVLGYQRLKRWLALLLTSAIDNPDLKPLMFLAVRRALLMEALVKAQGDSSQAGEVFICGIFSLLDRMLQQPFGPLLQSLPVPDGVRQVLVDGEGPYQGLLAAAVAVEAASPFDIRDAVDALMLPPGALNQALLSTLKAAWQMRGV